MPPSFPAREQVALPGKSDAALPATGLFAATKVWMALQSPLQQLLRHWHEGGMVGDHGRQHLLGDIRPGPTC